MILDTFDNIGRYSLPYIEHIRQCLANPFFWMQPVEEIVLISGELRLRPSRYMTRLPDLGKFETHEIFADLQYVVEGAEIMQVADSSKLQPVGPYDARRDFRFFSSDSYSSLFVPAGSFAVFYPGEAHRPCCQTGSVPEQVAKLVFKIRITKG